MRGNKQIEKDKAITLIEKYILELEDDNARLGKELSRVLWEFGEHDDRCSSLVPPNRLGPCDCGLSEERVKADAALDD